MRKFLYLILAIAAVAAWRDWGQRAIDRPPGVLVPEYPRQESAAPPQTLDIEGPRTGLGRDVRPGRFGPD